ncbi:MAG: box helicase [Paenibacillaceae bacterium]|jgi:ATP-dependent Lhr-like helicase|nr:box helicase [Paenibacillaceae bacterium]
MSLPFSFHPVIQTWFGQSFGAPTEVQQLAWSRISAGEHTLIAAPTGSGKTLAALLPCIDRIVSAKETADRKAEDVPPGIKVLYVTPLKALNNDIHHHLFRFAAEMSAAAKKTEAAWPGFTIGVRTGDTSQSTRASMLRHPPDLLVTTPESLYLMITSLKAREILRSVERVIIDEIHDLAADKRGGHLTLTLERLAFLCGRCPQRIGVSATQKPLERVARFLGGWEPGADLPPSAHGLPGSDRPSRPDQQGEVVQRPGPECHGPQDGQDAVRQLPGRDGHGGLDKHDEARPRPVGIVESAMERLLQVLVTMPHKGVRAMDKEAVWTPLVERLLEAMEGCRSVLVFVNNRRLCERLTLRLNDYAGYEMARSHHGSISREKRLEVEAQLKEGRLRCLVATATLELGIDVGHVDLVIQVDSPKQAAAGIQRIGRAGHAVGGVSRGTVIMRSRGDLPEAAVLAKAVSERDIEDIRIPRLALDVLAQHTVAAVASSAPGEEWSPGGLYRLFCQSDCYTGFPYDRYLAMLNVLSGLFPFTRPLIGWNREQDLLQRVPASAMAASMGGGTILQSSAFPVHHADTRMHLGELDEEFVHESRVGDVFQLGSGSWAIQSIRQDRVYVTESANPLSEIPFWRAEPGGRSEETGRRIGRLLAQIRASLQEQEAAEIMEGTLSADYCLDKDAASELMAYVRGQDKSSLVPTDTLILAEHYKDDTNRHHLVIHSLLGRRINRTWEMALRVRFDALSPSQVYSVAKDDGLEFIFSDWDRSWSDEIRKLTESQVEEGLWQALPGSSMFGKAFRHIAETALLLARGYERQPSWKKRFLSESLLKDALPYADRFPFLREAYAVCLEEYLDVPGLLRLLKDIRQGRIMLHAADSIAPSPFAMRFMNDYALTALYESDAMSRDIQLRLANVNRSLAAEWFGPDSLRSLISAESLREVEERLKRPEWLKRRTGADVKERARPLLRLLKECGDMTEEELSALWNQTLGSESGDGAETAGAQTPGEGERPAEGEEEIVRTEPVRELLRQLEGEAQAMRIRLGGEERWISRDEADWYAGSPGDWAWDTVNFIAGRYIERQLAFRTGEIAGRYGIGAASAEAWVSRWREEGTVEEAPFAGEEEKGLYTAAKVAGRIMHTSVRDFRARHGAIEPAAYAACLLHLHHLHPGSRLSGAEGLLEVIVQLQGVYLPLSYWESTLFPSRLTDYRKELLDQQCASGEIFWLGRKEPGDREGRIAFFPSGSRLFSDQARSAMDEPASSQPELLKLLQLKGASFLTALARETGELPSGLMPRLMDLVWEGRAGNDQFAPLRTPAAVKGKTGASKGGGFQSGLGRWYAVEPAGHDSGDIESAALQYCKHWIGQFGLLTRAAASLGSPFSWEQLSGVLRRLEEWGMVTRGFFVEGMAAMQYSTKEQVERLEAGPGMAWGEPVLVNAADPANPFGAWLDWPEVNGVQFSRKPGNFLVYDGGKWLLWLENFGRSIVELPEGGGRAAGPGLPPEKLHPLLARVLQTLFSCYHLRKIVLEKWNGGRSGESEQSALLTQLGGEKQQESFVFWPSSLKSR